MPEFSPYPIFLDLRQRSVLIVGGGGVGLRKAKSLLEAGAVVTVISPQFTAEFAELEGIRKVVGRYDSLHLAEEKWLLVFAATDNAGVNEQIAADARIGGILCCRCDDAADSDFTSAAERRVGGVTLVVSTGGASPALAVRIRDEAAKAIDPVLASLAGLLEPWRARVKAEIPAERRGALLKRLAGMEMEACLREKGVASAEELFDVWLADARGKQAV